MLKRLMFWAYLIVLFLFYSYNQIKLRYLELYEHFLLTGIEKNLIALVFEACYLMRSEVY